MSSPYPWNDDEWGYDELSIGLRWVQMAVDVVMGERFDLAPEFVGGRYLVSVWDGESKSEVALLEPGTDLDDVKNWFVETYPDADWEVEGWR